MATWNPPQYKEHIIVLDRTSYFWLLKTLFAVNPLVTILVLLFAILGMLSLVSIPVKDILLLLPFLGAAWVSPSSRSTGEIITASIWNQDVVNNIQFLYDRIPRRATLWHDEDTVLTGNNLVYTIDTSQAFNFEAEQSPAADGDSFQQGFYLQEGTYTMYVLGRTRSSSGKIDWYLDDTLIVSGQDWYSSAGASNVVMSSSGISVVGSGRHILKGVVNGKNGSSSGYRITITKVWFVPASDDIEVD